MQGVLISVIIPVYNVEEYLDECIRSVLNQTYKNIEIIVINDGSTDNSLEILERYSLENKNITVISQKNLGQSAARNIGIQQATGKYIYFLDADDYILAEALEQLVETMEENELDLCRFSAESFLDNIDKPINKNQYNFEEYFDKDRIYNNEEFLRLNFKTFTPSPVLYVIKREILVRGNIYFKAGIVHEDELFSLELFLNSKAIMYNSNHYYKRRYRPNSTMTNQSLDARKRSFNSRCIILDELNNMIDNYSNKSAKTLIQKRMRSVTTSLIFSYPDLSKSYKQEKIKNSKSISFMQFIYCYLRKYFKIFL